MSAAQEMDLTPFWRQLEKGPRPVLVLDYDGTLAPFREERAAAIPYGGVRERLAKLLALDSTRLAIVSGRSLNDLIPLLGLDPAPELWGSHGWERLPRGASEVEGPELPAATRRGLARGLETARTVVPAGWLEEKPASIAAHFRGLDEDKAQVLEEALRRTWLPVAAEAALDICSFSGGVELRAPGRDKGTAVARILEGALEGAAVAYLGDDLTDEDAFRVLRGRGLTVLVRPERRDTLAELWLRPPEQLLEFLDLWHRHAHHRKE